jgi:predicted transcriptional regulator
MDFACKKIDIEEVMKCSLGVTKAELLIMKTIVGMYPNIWFG